MRILIINGSSRDNGYTNDIINLFSHGAEKAGGKIDHIVLKTLNIAPCEGCYACWKPERAGTCRQTDDMGDLLQRYTESNAVVFATPVYFYSFSARLKVFLERLLPLTKPELVVGRKIGLLHNKLRHDDEGPRKAVLIAVAGHRDPRLLDGIKSTFDLVTDSLKLEQCGKLLRTESFFMDFSMAKPLTLRRVRSAIENAGKELVERGTILPETEKKAALHLTADSESYAERFTHYWQIASESDGFVTNREALKKRVLGDLRIMMPELALCLDPVAAGDLEAVFLFEIEGDQPGPWQLAISNGKCLAIPATCESPSVTIRTTSQTLLDIFRQRLDARRAIADGALKVSGDVRLFMRFRRLFPPPAG